MGFFSSNSVINTIVTSDVTSHHGVIATMYHIIARWVRAEKFAGYMGEGRRQQMFAKHVIRVCKMYGWKGNPY